MPRLSKIGAAALAAFGWTSGANAVTASYLVVAGGGSGGYQFGGGGGAGGLLTGTASLSPANTYTVTVGAGGSAPSTTGNSGSNSVLSGTGLTTVTSTGGGGGGSHNGTTAGQSGGSGGGGAYYLGAAGTGTAGQGNNGGANATTNGVGGGGGGAGAAGTAATGNAGAGGNGLTSSITGTSTYYAGGGSGGGNTGTIQAGGLGGGGTGGIGGPGTAGTANTGGGGGGNNGDSNGAGGSGVVIISYLSPQKFGGGIVTTSGANTIHTFNTSGTLSPLSTLTINNYLIVAGGAAGIGGGGGAGGMQTGSGVVIDTNSIYVVTVGAGGAGALPASGRGASGGNSSFSAYATASVGGGGGGSGDGTTGANGGSGGGGGGGVTTTSGGTGTAGQGNNGGTGFLTGGRNPSGGGGGAGAVGGNATSASTSTGGNGGAGLASSISGTSTYYAGGGGGAGDVSGSGGIGGGGAGSTPGVATSGTANTGGGGGGVFNNFTTGSGGSGIVIISYAGATQLMAGGTVTISGGNVIHTFTSSGYLTPLKLVNNSLRFRSSASAYLNRTPSTAGNRRTFTWSGWVKRGSLGASRRNMISAGTWSGGNLISAIAFDDGTADTLYVFCDIYGSGNQWQLRTTQVFRDPAAWYHIVVAVDTTQATSSNRVKIYVNGTQVTAFSTATYPSLNFDNPINNTVIHEIGASTAGEYFDGYQTEVNLVDGQALTPNSFGTFNSYGVWQPITYGGSYGTNGFYLPFTNTASTTTLGYDFSPQGNNWTTNNISLTTGSTYDSMTDVPTLTSATAANYCVMNPLKKDSAVTLTDGNLYISSSSGAFPSFGSMVMNETDGYYAEFLVASTDGVAGPIIGVADVTTNESIQTNMYVYKGVGYRRDGQVWRDNVLVLGSLTALTVGATLSVAYKTGKVWFGVNGVWQNSGNPAAGTGQCATASAPVGGYVFATNAYSGAQASANFGQQPFVYTLPTGFVALNTYNI